MSAKDVMEEGRIASGVTVAKGLAALVEDHGRLLRENRELRDDADGYKGVEQALDLLVRDFGIEMDETDGGYWRDQVSSIRKAMDGMRLMCNAVARAVDDDERRRYTVDELADELRKRLMPEGMSWPRFEDGRLVRPGDCYIDYDRFERTVGSVMLYGDGSFELCAVGGFREPFSMNERVQLPFEQPEREEPSDGMADSWDALKVDAIVREMTYCKDRGIPYASNQDAYEKKAADIIRRAKKLAGVAE